MVSLFVYSIYHTKVYVGKNSNRSFQKGLRSQFGPNAYNLVTKNCNSFANALVWALLRRTIPSHVNRLADVGSCCSCLLPKKMLEAAPVGDTNNSNGYQVSGSHGRLTSPGPNKNEMSRPFVGTGNTLGSCNSNNSNSNGDSTIGMSFQNMLNGGRNQLSSNEKVDNLTDRREKARQAALARLERNGGDNKNE